MRTRRGRRRALDRQCRAEAVPRDRMGVVPLARRRGPGLPVVPVGRAAARDGPARSPVCPEHHAAAIPELLTIAITVVSAVVAAVSPHIRLRVRQAHVGRSDVAQPQRAGLPLLDAAAAHLDCVVCEPQPPMAQARVRDRHVCAGAGCACAAVRHSAHAPGVVPGSGRDAGPDRCHGQLHVLQPADHRARLAAAR